MLKLRLLLCAFSFAAAHFATGQATVRVEDAQPQGPRALEEQTRTAVIRDYLKSWQSLKAALERNQVESLDADFTGTARDRLIKAIRDQHALGIHTFYEDRAHDIQIVFYSPEGTSIELTDSVDYDVRVVDHGKAETTQQVHARYIAILTPTEVRWKVRILQADPE